MQIYVFKSVQFLVTCVNEHVPIRPDTIKIFNSIGSHCGVYLLLSPIERIRKQKKNNNNVFFDLFPQFLCFYFVFFFFKWFLSCVHLWQIINHIFCSADGHYEVTLMTKATVYNTGLVVWQPPAVYKSSCSIDVEYFPYDVQTCVLKLGSWTYDGFKVPHLISNSNFYITIYIYFVDIIHTHMKEYLLR